MTFDKIRRDVLRDRERWCTIAGYQGFCTGPDNPRGFRLTPQIEVGRVSVNVVIEEVFTGHPGIAHGGATFAVLDDLMGWLVMSHLGRAGFTTRSSIVYFAPLYAGREYVFDAIPDGEPYLASGAQKVRLLGRVFSADRPNLPFIEVRAELLLAGRRMAEKVLGRSLDPVSAELFPDD